MTDRERKVLDQVRRLGLLRPKDLAPCGIPRVTLSRMVEKGILIRTGRGLYALPDADITEHHSLAAVAKRFPEGVVCLLSALRFHDLTTQSPFEVWFAIGLKARKPALGSPQLRIVRFASTALCEGVEIHRIENVPVRVTEPARTVADLFKYRHKVGLDAALEALLECRRKELCAMDELWHYAKLDRVQNVIRPYLEAVAR
jgi:predicted transcriptional regulator of viral defense system